MIRHFASLLVIWALLLAALCAGLVYEAAHHRYLILAPFFAVVFAAVFYKSVLGRRAQVRRRARALRWRARLRLRPGPGYASLSELVFRWGRLAALHHGGRARPGLGFWRPGVPRGSPTTRSGSAGLSTGRRCMARMEDQHARPGAAAHRQVRHHRRPAARPSRPGHRHVDPHRPV